MTATRESVTPAPHHLSESASRIGRNIAIVGLLSVASRVIGLLREIIIARQFGTSGEYDAYLTAFRIPDLLFLLVITASFGSAFIPVFRGLLDRDEEKAWRLASAVITWTALITVVASVITFIFAEPIVKYFIGSGLPPDMQVISAKMMRILLLSPILLGMGIAAKGILETHNRFTLPALAPLMYNAGIIFGAVMLSPHFGVTGLAVGVVIGAALYFVIEAPGLKRVGMRFKPTLSREVEGLKSVAFGMAPRVVGQAAFQLNFLIVTILAQRQGEGKVSALNYAFAIMMLPNAVLGQSFATVLFPTMTAQFERGDVEGLRKTLSSGLRPLLFLVLPASVGLYAFRVPIVQTVFQSGAFSSASTMLVVQPLAIFALALVFYSLVEILARTFYAMRNTRIPVGAGIFITVINIVVAIIITPHVGYSGLALSLSLSTALEALILIVALSWKMGRFDAEFGAWFARVVLATAIMGCGALLLSNFLIDRMNSGNMNRFVSMIFMGYAMVLVAGIYFAAAFALRLEETARWLSMAHRMSMKIISRTPFARG